MSSFTVGNIETLKARIGIPESEIGSIEEGNKARVTFASHPGTVLTGTLVRLSRITSQRSITFEGVVEFPNPDGIILPGITSRIVLERRRMENVITVPLESVLNKAAGTVIMTEKDGLAYENRVVLGPTDGTVVVVETGISAGDRIIVGGNHVVSAGKAVQPVLQ